MILTSRAQTPDLSLEAKLAAIVHQSLLWIYLLTSHLLKSQIYCRLVSV
jgi:hypothetical protein